MGFSGRITLIFSISVLFLLSLLPQKLHATHAQGADLTYTCLGNDEFELQASFYRDCEGNDAPNSVTVNATSATCGEDLDVTLTQVAGTGQDVTPICDAEETECEGGNNPGVEEYVYTGTVTLPQACPDWTFDMSICCRNHAITTIDDPGNEDIHLQTQLNSQDYPCNSSPTFNNPPVPYICVGETYCFNHGAQDPDGDSLSYSLVTPSTGPNNTVTYDAGYSATSPISSSTPISVDPTTGDICMTPTQQEVSVMEVRVEEWRNGEMIGAVHRDIQVQVIPCSNQLPSLSGIDGNGNFTDDVCAGEQVQFNLPSHDSDATQDLTLSWDSGIPSGQFDPGTGSRPTGEFTWTPNASHVGNGPHCFTVEVKDDNCPINGSQVYSFCFTVDGMDSLALSSTSANCGASNGSAQVDSVYGGEGNFDYTWTPDHGNNGSANYNGIPAGTYTVEVTDDGGCTRTDSVTVDPGTQPATPNLSTTDPSCAGANDGSATVNPNGGQGPYDYSWSNGDTTATANDLSAGTYYVDIVTDEGCHSSDTVTLQDPAPLTISLDSLSEPLCHGDSNGYGEVSVQGGTSPYNIEWSTTPAQTGNQVNDLYAGSFTVTATDANGCSNLIEVNVGQPDPLSSSMSTQDLDCYGDSDGEVSVSVSGGKTPYQYDWQGYPSQNGNTLNSLDAGQYVVEITDANGCSIIDSARLQEPNPLSIDTLNMSHPLCNGDETGSVQVDVNGGTTPYTYDWSSLNVNAPQVTGLGAGSYQLEVTDDNGCSVMANFQIDEPAPLQVSMDSLADPLCHGDSNGYGEVNVQGGTAPYNVDWSTNPALSGTQVNSLYEGSFTVTATDDNGCTDSLQIEVDEPAPLTSSMSTQDPLCNGGTGQVSVSVSGGTSPYQYDWQGYPGQNGNTLSNVGTGQYVVEITDENGCSINDTAQIQEPAPLTIDTLEVIEPVCNGDENGSITVEVDGGTDPYSYDWGSLNSDDHHASGVGAGNYQLEVTDSNGCSAVANFQLTEPSPLDARIDDVFDASCHGGSDGSALASATGGNGGYNFSWNVDSPQTGNSAFNLSAGDHSLTVTDQQGCEDTANFQVGEPAPMDVQVTPFGDTICPGDSLTLTANGSGGNGGYFYVWDQGLGAGAAHTVGPTQTTDYSVTAYDSSGCSSSEESVSIDVKNLDRGAFAVNGESPVCEGEMTTISAEYLDEGMTVSFQWDQGMNGPGPHHVLPNDTTTYTATLKDNCDNELVDSTTIAVLPDPPVKVEVPDVEDCGEADVVCHNDTNINASTDIQWEFSNGKTSDAEEPVVSFSNSGQYSAKLTLTSDDGCENVATENFEVEVYPMPSADFEMDPGNSVSIMDAEVNFHYNDPYAIFWSFDFGDGDSSQKRDPSHTYDKVGTYPVTLKAETQYGCKATKVKEVVVEDKFTYYVPNAFSPDGDGINDEFNGKGTGYVAREMMIFDRWGELIFETSDPDEGWDGTVNGQKAKPDTYVYKIMVKDHRGRWHEKEGEVTVVR